MNDFEPIDGLYISNIAFFNHKMKQGQLELNEVDGVDEGSCNPQEAMSVVLS